MTVKEEREMKIIRRTYVIEWHPRVDVATMCAELAQIPSDAVCIEWLDSVNGGLNLCFRVEEEEK